MTGRPGVLVTGSSRGIGRAVAVAFAELGHRVCVHYASSRRDGAATLDLLTGDGHVLVGADISDPAQARGLVVDAVAGLGTLDVLVNNAATAPSESNRHPIDEGDFEAWTRVWRETMEVNLFGAANVSWAFARQLIERKAPGSIVNVGSRGAFRGEPDYPAYGASKAALHAFGQSIAVTLAPHGISVTSVAPGFIGTERQSAKLSGRSGDAVRGQSPFGRVGTPEEVAAAVVYLASPAATWSSGAVLDLNGASYLRT